jgi:DNA-binding response OmpR family regulator
MRLLLVEDNLDLAGLVVEGLARHDFMVDHAATLDAAEALHAVSDHDLILLDLGLPDGDGMDLVRRLRRGGGSVPILILTARDGLDQRLAGLDGGADDYLIKPFAIAELAARCRALLRRPGACLGIQLSFGNIALDTVARSVSIEGSLIDTSPRETALLEVLLRRAGQVVPRDRLAGSLYALDIEVTSNALDAAVSRLRKTLDAAGADVRLTTIYGVGYALFAPETEADRAG